MNESLDKLIEQWELDPAAVEREALGMIAESRAYELREARKQEHVTQGELAARMGISQARISEVENGEVGSLKVDTLRRYAEALGGTFQCLMSIDGKTIRLA